MGTGSSKSAPSAKETIKVGTGKVSTGQKSVPRAREPSPEDDEFQDAREDFEDRLQDTADAAPDRFAALRKRRVPPGTALVPIAPEPTIQGMASGSSVKKATARLAKCYAEKASMRGDLAKRDAETTEIRALWQKARSEERDAAQDLHQCEEQATLRAKKMVLYRWGLAVLALLVLGLIVGLLVILLKK